jgi:voltage-gated potassium channel
MEYDAPVRSDLDRTAGILRWRFLAVGGVLVSATLIGTLGFRLVEGWPLFDAFYMALITLTTVGYGEVHPLSFHGRVFASFLMLVGVATVFVSFAILGDTLLRLELADYFGRRRRTRMLQHIAGHYIVCGAGRVGRSVVLELLRGRARVVLIDNDTERVKWGEALGIVTLTADASKDETLRQARIDTAAGLVSAISSDAENVYVTLSAKVLNPSLHVAVRASDEQAKEKLQRAGASTVLTPYTYIGHRLAQSLLRPHVVSFLDVASAFGRTDLDLEIEQLPVAPGSFLSSKTLEEGHLGRTYGVIVLAVRRQSGTMQFNPQADVRLEGGDVLIAMGERQKLKQLENELSRVNDGTAGPGSSELT